MMVRYGALKADWRQAGRLQRESMVGPVFGCIVLSGFCGFRCLGIQSARIKSLALRTVLGVGVVLSLAGISAGETIYVPDDYASIQEAIDAASAGDIVLVRPGTYYENIDLLGKAITVSGELGSDQTVIDGRFGSESVVAFVNERAGIRS